MTTEATSTTSVTDSVHDLLRAERPSPLEVFFAPKSVAVIGAT